jgi:hypothetical protein
MEALRESNLNINGVFRKESLITFKIWVSIYNKTDWY